MGSDNQIQNRPGIYFGSFFFCGEVRFFGCPQQEIIINIFSDREYMQGLYNRLIYIKAMRVEKF